ncbi:alkaline phosphatase [Acidovorax sp. sic0104]|uniref:alkaline phosphatase D family protein n=1 Tax=Acidovorax sp. sic0104 TaxID=2854784 RepID=UPI001C47562F|nr:alkaline phosphatase D family protein [Acidovorax sp. sic0104]MBV7544081.1 alkaline phosphatase D family protein [Acidovorax sp. sic0104]
MDRRAFLQLAASAATASALPHWAWSNAPSLSTHPFALGVASGDPAPDGVVLWTRLALADAAQLQTAHTVRWEVAHDARFAQIVQKGQAPALPQLGHSVHVELRGLQPGRWYHYRFMLGDAVSTVGRTRTAPAAGDLPDALRVAFASCQRWEHGHYAAWRHLAADQPDLVLFLGDYIYEYATPKNAADLARTHSLKLATTLADYRDRYALHKSDPALQAAHAACPWAVTWDDHEVQNDYAASAGRGGDTGSFLAQRGAAWQAFYENMPLRATSLTRPFPDTRWDALQVYRLLRWGRLAHIHLLDARQYRSWQACRAPDSGSAGAVRGGSCAELADPARTFLGAAQEQWIDAGLAADAAAQDATRWSVIAQQTLFAQRHYPSGTVGTDSWAGYPAARARLLQSVTRHAPRNTVLLGGDIHQNYVCRVHADMDRPDSAVIASEFCGTSISSRSGTTQDKVDAVARHNPHVLLARCDQRGYGLAHITPARWTTTLRVVDDPMRADSGASTLARFVVEDGRAGPVQA